MHFSITFVCTIFSLFSFIIILYFRFDSVFGTLVGRLQVLRIRCRNSLTHKFTLTNDERARVLDECGGGVRRAAAQRMVTVLLLYIMWLSSSQQQWQWRHQYHSHMKSTMKYKVFFLVLFASISHSICATKWYTIRQMAGVSVCSVCACVHRQMCDAWLPANVKICIPFCRLFYFCCFCSQRRWSDHAIDAIVLWTAHEFI